ncbi:CPBP family intramembrane glutamic endopeptidase [Thermopolyspora sp. NPDC052614]|uniref:CPBP family intramembrane glutamic endopeptidase n=1 Tax=Thermopolyspora sp. NPDC052614 TaxID=3155682 RepID=UPI00341D3D0F
MPVWLGGGLSSPLVYLVGTAMMATPSLGVLAVWLLNHRDVPLRKWAAQTGLGLGESKKRTFALVAAAWLGIPLLAVLAIAVSAALGLLTLDIAGLSLFRQTLERSTPGATLPADPAILAAVQIGTALLIAPLLNAIPALGEEWGWRGWLLPHLTRLGTARALLLSGVIWGAWHAPLTLLGYNYAELGPWAALAFVGFCVIFGVVLGWTRLYAGSAWPAVFGHATLNAWGGLPLIIGDAAAPPNLFLAGITGLVGWALLAIPAAVVLRRWPVGSEARTAAGVG